MAKFLDFECPKVDESLEGFLWRFAKAQHHDTSRWITQEAGLGTGQGVSWTADGITRLADLIGIAPEYLLRRAHLVEGTNVSFFDHTLWVSQIEAGTVKACPECLAEGGYHSAIFNLASIQVCPRHRKRLHSACPTCQTRFRWGRGHPFRCSSCNEGTVTNSDARLPDWEISGTIALARLLGFAAPLDESVSPIPVGLRHLPPEALIAMIAGLGTFACSEPGQRTWKPSFSKHRAEAHKIIEVGWQLIVDWPQRFEAFLDLLVDEQTRLLGRKPLGLDETYARAYRHLATEKKEPWPTMLSLLDSHALENAFVVGRCSSQIEAGRSTRSARYINAHDLARLPGIGTARAQKILALTDVEKFIIDTGKVNIAFVDRHSLEERGLLDAEPIDLRAAAKMLDLGEAVTRELIKDGILEAICGPHVTGDHRYLLSEGVVVRFMKKLLNLVPTSDAASEEGNGHVRLSRLFKAKNTLDIPTALLFDAIWTGRLRVSGILKGPTGKPKRGISGILFPHDDVRTLSLKVVAQARGDTIITRQEAMRILKVKKATIVWLERHGLLKVAEAKGNLRPILRQSYDAFVETWVKIGDLAEQFSTSRMLMTRALQEANVPSTPISNDSSIAVFFRRDAIASIDIPKMLDVVALYRGKAWGEYASGLEKRNSDKAAR